jgi:hypothetical protein
MYQATEKTALGVRICFLVIALLIAAGTQPVLAGDIVWEGKLEPAWLSGDGDNTFGVSFEGSAATSGHWVDVRLSTKGTLALDEEVNPDPISAELKLFKTWDFYEPPTGGNDPFGNPDQEMNPGHDYGSIEAGLVARFETDQETDNYGWAFGIGAGYLSMAEIIPKLPLNVSVYANLERVKPVESETRECFGLDEEDYSRFRAAASIKYKVGAHFARTALNPIALHGDVRYYQDLDAPEEITETGLDTDIYWACTVSYELNDLGSAVKGWPVDAIFVRISGGRVPPETRDETTVFLGFVIESN